MNQAEFQELVEGLRPRQREVYTELLERGPRDRASIDQAGLQGREIRRLEEKGLVRWTGKRKGKQMLWEAVSDAGEVEAVAATAASRYPNGKRSRPSSDRSNPVGLRVAEFRRLADDPEVQAAILDPAGSTRRQRSRLKAQLKKNRAAQQARARELHEFKEKGEAHTEFIRTRNNLLDAVERIYAIGGMLEDEHEQILEAGTQRFERTWWSQLVAPLADAVAKAERAYGLLMPLTDCEPLPGRDDVLDGEAIEDAEVVGIILELESSDESA